VVTMAILDYRTRMCSLDEHSMFNVFSRSESSHHHQQHVALLATAVVLYFEQRKTHLAGKKHRALELLFRKHRPVLRANPEIPEVK
jgi:hypothetical protein